MGGSRQVSKDDYLAGGVIFLPETARFSYLLKLISPVDLSGDAFGKVYEYFLGNFALREGQKGDVQHSPSPLSS